MDKVLITGCGGMLGSALYPVFSKQYRDVLATDKQITEQWLTELDVRDHASVRRTFEQFQPDLVLHLAAETNLEFCETHQNTATATNAVATGNIVKLCEEYESTLVYVSTAGVFDGVKTDYYVESDRPNPIMVYGRTKYEGELHVLNHCSKGYVIRAGWMMGGGRKKEKKFIYKILQQIGEGKTELFAVDDRWGTPTYTEDFASNLLRLLETREYGLYHMVCEGKGTRHDVAAEILKICNRNDIKLTPVNSDFFKEQYFAPRPVSEMMINAKLRAMGCHHMRSWKMALREYIEHSFADYIEPPLA